MMKNNLLFFYFFLFFAASCFSQKASKQIVLADQKYEKQLYIDALAIYLELAVEGYLDENGLKKLANSYYFNSDYPNAHLWYELIFASSPLQSPEYYYRYGQSLKSIGKYDEATKVLLRFAEMAKEEVRAKLINENKDYLQKINDNSNRYAISKLNINSAMTDFGVSKWGERLVFSSSRSSKKSSKSRNQEQRYVKLFVSQPKSDGDFSDPVLLFKKKYTRFNESSAIFTKDGQTMYFTKNVDLSRKQAKKFGVTLKIYKATLKNGKWKRIVELPFNSNKFSTSHPALSTDESTLFFASDRPGTYGQSDLFYVSILPHDKYSDPLNMGNLVNTEGKESFPYVANDNQLYFSSDGHPGLGGLDVFVAEKENNNTYGNIRNLGKPINSMQDDYAYSINSFSHLGYFSSNRLDNNRIGKGSDDIYQLHETQKIGTHQHTVTVFDKFTNMPLQDVTVVLLDDQFNPLFQSTTDSRGIYKFPKVLNDKINYLRVATKDYLTQEIALNTIENSNTLGHQNKSTVVYLEKRINPISNGDDLAKLLDIGNLYFQFEKHEITPKASLQLKKIVKAMNLYPEIKINIKTHTDSRGTTEFNQRLSNKRYKAIEAWLIEKGIASNRLSGKGYGETQLINKCSDAVPCTVAEHELNRRSEFIFTK